MKEKITKKHYDKIDELYSEDVGDYLYDIRKLSEFFYFTVDETKLMIYWGDSDVNNCDVIFKEDADKIRSYSNEHDFAIDDLRKRLIEIENV